MPAPASAANSEPDLVSVAINGMKKVNGVSAACIDVLSSNAAAATLVSALFTSNAQLDMNAAFVEAAPLLTLPNWFEVHHLRACVAVFEIYERLFAAERASMERQINSVKASTHQRSEL